jgi:hypothetical protein
MIRNESIDVSSEEYFQEHKTAYERAADVAEKAAKLKEHADGFVSTCDQSLPMYGALVENQPCNVCKEGHPPNNVLAPCGGTQDKLERLYREMQRLRKAKQEKLGLLSQAPFDEEALQEKKEELANYCFKPKPGSVDEGESDGDSTPPEEVKKDVAAPLTRYAIGVVESVSDKGELVSFAACSGFKPTPLFRDAYNNVKTSFNGLGYIHPNTYNAFKAKQVDLPCYAKKGKPSTAQDLKNIGSNPPGVCAEAKLIQRSLKAGSVPYCMSVLFVDPSGIDNSDMPPLAAPCKTCENNLPQLLCGLENAQKQQIGGFDFAKENAESKYKRATEYRQERLEKEEKEKLAQKARKQEAERQKQEAELQNQNKDVDLWFEKLCEKIPEEKVGDEKYYEKVEQKAKKLALDHGAFNQKKHTKLLKPPDTD